MGVTGGIRPTPRNVALHGRADPGRPRGRRQLAGDRGLARPVEAARRRRSTLGGNVRAGLEDNLYLPDGEMARSNGDLIAKARQMAEDVGRRAATVAEAREMLGRRRERDASCRLATSASSTSPGCCRAASARCCSPTSAPTWSRSRTPGWATTCAGRRPTTATRRQQRARHPLGALPVAQPRQALDPRSTSSPTPGARRSCGSSRDADVVLESFRPGVLDRLGVGYERLREVEPADRLLRDHRLRPDGPNTARAGHDTNYLGAQRPARAHRRGRRPADPVGGPDRRPRRRRADGRLRRSWRRCTSASARARASSSTSR